MSMVNGDACGTPYENALGPVLAFPEVSDSDTTLLFGWECAQECDRQPQPSWPMAPCRNSMLLKHPYQTLFSWPLYFFALAILVLASSWFYGGRIVDGYIASGKGHSRWDTSIFEMDRLTGALIRNIVKNADYRACYPLDEGLGNSNEQVAGTLCMSAARMPLIPLLGALSSRISDSLLFFIFAKSILFFGMAAGGIWLVAKGRTVSPAMIWGLSAALFLNPVNLTNGIQPASEEGFLFGLLALLMAVMLSHVRGLRAENALGLFLAVGVILALLPMTKSSAIIVAIVLAFAFLSRLRWWRWTPVIPLAVVFSTLMSWGTFIEDKTGHFAFGASMSSINSLNFYKGNNPQTLEIYPANNVDEEKIEFARAFVDEWDYYRYLDGLAKEFVISHPAATLTAAAAKVYVALFKVTPELRPSIPEWATPVDLRYWVTVLGLVINRLILWTAIVVAVKMIWCRVRIARFRDAFSDDRAFGAALFLLVLVSWLIPLVAGFALYRHLVPLYFAAGVFLLWHQSSTDAATGSGLTDQ
jgi:hypothetical protein